MIDPLEEPCEVCGICPDEELLPCTYQALWEAIPPWGEAQEAGLTTYCEECGRQLTGPNLVSADPLNW